MAEFLKGLAYLILADSLVVGVFFVFKEEVRTLLGSAEKLKIGIVTLERKLAASTVLLPTITPARQKVQVETPLTFAWLAATRAKEDADLLSKNNVDVSGEEGRGKDHRLVQLQKFAVPPLALPDLGGGEGFL